MIITNCSNVIDAFTHCKHLDAIYTRGSLVWPTGPTPPSNWYVSCTPTNLSGTFSMFGRSYRLQDYSGFYSWTGRRSYYITDVAFRSIPFDRMETNVYKLKNGTSSTGTFRDCDFWNISLPSCSYIGSWAFYNCRFLGEVSFPMCEYIGDSAFAYVNNRYSSYFTTVGSISLPVCSYIGKYAFFSCNYLLSIYLPMCKYIDEHAFQRCSFLSSAYIPMCEYIGSYAFYSMMIKGSLDLSVCSYISSNAFQGCSKITSISLPVCSHIGNDAFEQCYTLSSIYIPMCRTIEEAAFRYCDPKSVSLPMCTYIGYNAFRDCSNLNEITLASTSICYLYHSNAFSGTKISLYGSIYVPSSLVNDYKTATNWSYYSSRIFPIPE